MTMNTTPHLTILAGVTTFELDIITRENSGFTSFRDLVDSFPHYTPTIDVSTRDRLVLACAYDHHQAARGVPNRAYRRGTPPAPATPKLFRGLVAGDAVTVFRNQGDRDGHVLAVRGDKALIIYEMPSGVEYMNIVAADGSDEPGCYSTVSPKALSKAWRDAVEAQGQQL